MTQAPPRRPRYTGVGDAVARARELVQGLTARLPEAEAGRRLPDQTVRDLLDSGLLLLLVPRAMGGSELNYDAVLDVTATLGEAYRAYQATTKRLIPGLW